MKKELKEIVEETYKILEKEGAFGFQAPEKLRESGYFVDQTEWRLTSVMFDKDFEYTETDLKEALNALFELASKKFHGDDSEGEQLTKEVTNKFVRNHLERKDITILGEDYCGFDFVAFDREKNNVYLIKTFGKYFEDIEKTKEPFMAHSVSNEERANFEKAMFSLAANGKYSHILKRYNLKLYYSKIDIAAYGGEGAHKPSYAFLRRWIDNDVEEA